LFFLQGFPDGKVWKIGSGVAETPPTIALLSNLMNRMGSVPDFDKAYLEMEIKDPSEGLPAFQKEPKEGERSRCEGLGCRDRGSNQRAF
jgi:hypothetical protein